MKPTPLLICLIGIAFPMAGLAQPTITVQPQSQTSVVGSTLTLSVEAAGVLPLSYRWRKSGATVAGATNAALVFTNWQSSQAGNYTVVITNVEGAVTSAVAVVRVLVPPAIILGGQPTDKVVAAEGAASFSVSANGTTPLSYQWRFESADLPGATNPTLSIPRTQLTNAGAYTVQVSNLAGGVTSRVAQLSVAQASVYTNAQGARLSYRLFSPPRYEPAKKYPLVLFWHGAGELGTDNLAQLADLGQFVFLSATNQAQYPCFYLAPQIPVRPSNSSFETYYLGFQDLAAELLSLLQTQFNIDADRLYVTGLSLGGVNSWAMVARYPNLFAAAIPMSGGWGFTNIADLYPDIRLPVWNFHANDDDTVAVSYSDAAVDVLRNAGGNPIYTRYQTGGHVIWPQAYSTPGLVDWMMAQVRGAVSTNEPLLSITNPTLRAVLLTNATNLNLAGSAGLGRDVTRVTWMNFANSAMGVASGTDHWSATNIPLQAGRNNMIVVVGTTTSWAPAYGGDTTFNDTLAVVSIRAAVVPGQSFVAPGGSVTLSLTNTLSVPSTYQWQFNGTNLPGATSSTLALSNLAPAQSGRYSVTVSNEYEVVTTAPALVQVVDRVTIIAQPQSTNAPAGSNVTFSVTALSPLPVTYQWQRNSTNLPGATNASLSFTSVQFDPHTGYYRVLVSDTVSNVLSDTATLIVLVRPTITSPPVAQTVLQGGTAIFSVSAIPDHPLLPLNYRWQRQGVTFLTNAPPTLVITNVQPGTAGSFRVTITNLAGATNSASVNLTVLPDFDRDGMADAWENLYGFNTNNLADALLDFDGDGMSNRDECNAGTNPTNAASVLKLQMIPVVPGTKALTFPAISNRTYTVEWNTQVTGGTWNRLQDVLAQPADRSESVTDTNASGPIRFYRVVTPKRP